MIVHINQMDGTALGAGHAGFADTNITNITSGELANFLDGTYSRTGDMGQASGTSQPVTVLLREALSGTYNTMEYNVPNTVENQTSIDVGGNQQPSQVNCPANQAGGIISNPMNIPTASGGARQRVIGTGEMENVMFGISANGNINRPTGSTLGWSFWSRPNFQNAYSGTFGNASTFADARYLTVDGVDPLMANYGPYTPNPVPASGVCSGGTCPAGTIPTLSNGGLTAVTMPHVIDGSYPIWSFLRLVCIGTTTNSISCNEAAALASNAQIFDALGSSVTAQTPPDFVPVTSNPATVSGLTYVSGGSLSGTGFVTLSSFNNSCSGTTAYIVVNGGVAGTVIPTAGGSGCTAPPTTATCASGTGATCSGTVTLTSTLAGVGSTAWNSVVVRSHFTPPGTTIKCGSVANGTTLTTITAHKAPECGGDVGGVVFTVTGDIDYETDFQTTKYVGEINHRR